METVLRQPEPILNRRETLATLRAKKVNGISSADAGDLLIENIVRLNKPADRNRYSSSEFEFPSLEAEEGRLRIVHGFENLEKIEPGLGAITWRKSQNLRRLSKTAGTHLSLRFPYDGPFLKEATEDLLEFAHQGLDINNGKAVRNRLKMVREEIKDAVYGSVTGNGEPFNILSIAAGSGVGVLRSLAELEADRLRNISLLMVDNSKSAKKDGEELAKSMGLGDTAKFGIQNIMFTDEYLTSYPSLHLIEADGIVDYLNRYKAVHLLSESWKALVPGGSMICSNIIPNDEEAIMRDTILWPPMYHRTASEFLDLFKTAGFEIGSLRLRREPCGLYNVVIATKRIFN